MPYSDIEVRREKDRENKRRYIRYAKENGLCIQCHKPIEEDRQGKTICIECSDKRYAQQKATREFCESIGICNRCSKNKVFGNEKTCPECRAKNAEYKFKIREANREKYNEYNRSYGKKRYNELKEKGICTRCAKRPATDGKTMCSICNAKNNKRREQTSNGRDRVSNGLCYWCGAPVKTGYKICEEHYSMSVKKLQHPNVEAARQQFRDREHIRYINYMKVRANNG